MLGVEFGVEVFSAGIMCMQAFMKVDHISQILYACVHLHTHTLAQIHSMVISKAFFFIFRKNVDKIDMLMNSCWLISGDI
jgi:hypothetical protein